MRHEYVLRESDANKFHEEYKITPFYTNYCGVFGHKKYVSEIHNTEAIIKLYEIVAVPFYFAIEVDVRNINPVFISNYVDIVKELFTRTTGVVCNRCEVIKHPNTLQVYPLIDEEYVYIADNEISAITLLDTSVFLGKGLVSGRDGALIAVEDLGEIPSCREIDGLVVYDILTTNLISVEELSLRMERVRCAIDSDVQSGTVFFNRKTISDVKRKALLELTHVWDFYRNETPEYMSYTPKSDNSTTEELFGTMKSCTFEKWLKDSIYCIISREQPVKVRVIGDWMYVDVDAEKNRSKVVYCAHYSFNKVVDNNSHMSSLRDFMTVLPDLSISLPVLGPDDYNIFSREMKMMTSDLSLYYVHQIPLDTDPKEIYALNRRFNSIVVGLEIVTTSPTLITTGIPNELDEDVDVVPVENTWREYLMSVHEIQI